jgi:prepilin-type N-terminal cleavage/methylation domain-containing protein
LTRPSRRPIRAGFTLFELLLAIVLVGLLAVFLWPDSYGVLRGAQLDESVDRVQALLSMSRAKAMNEARRYRIAFRPDGTIWVWRQRDPLLAPDEYELLREGWANRSVLLDDVWVAAFQPLPEGPPPIRVEDELLEFTEFQDDPPAMTQADQDHLLDIEPDGASASARWDVRDASGRGVRMTLDGRIGRIRVEALARMSESPRPERLPEQIDGPAQRGTLAEAPAPTLRATPGEMRR